MKVKLFLLLAGAFLVFPAIAGNLGLPDVPVPADNPQSLEKVALGDKLFNDTRFSSTGEVSCATCHDPLKGGTDSPLKTSEGINGLTGTRNAPPVMNAAFNKTQFWDGRSPDLEDQARHPFLNPVEMGLPSHEPIVEIVNNDEDYIAAFQAVFGAGEGEVTIDLVTQAIAAFERTQVGGDSAWDRWYFGGQQDSADDAVKRGFQVFLAEGRCVSCHAIEQDFALFTDHLFHNIGVGINDIQPQVPELAQAFLLAKAEGADVDVTVLTNPNASHLGRFAVDEQLSSLGAFKTPTLRNIALTAPYMHDGSLATLRDVVVHYNNGGVSKEGDPVNPFISGGIRPLKLTEDQIDDLVAFMEALTSVDLQELQSMTTGDKGNERIASASGSADAALGESE
jgi:cytochrome c peroxidase